MVLKPSSWMPGISSARCSRMPRYSSPLGVPGPATIVVMLSPGSFCRDVPRFLSATAKEIFFSSLSLSIRPASTGGTFPSINLSISAMAAAALSHFANSFSFNLRAGVNIGATASNWKCSRAPTLH